jgi:hypothetical protein
LAKAGSSVNRSQKTEVRRQEKEERRKKKEERRKKGKPNPEYDMRHERRTRS